MEIELDVENYDVFLNPKIVAVTDINEYAWERCASYIGCRAQVKRPIGIRLAYQDETGALQEKGKENYLIFLDYFDFKARVVCHEVEHLNGSDMMHWSVSEGAVKVDENFDEDYQNYKEEIEKYSEKLMGLKRYDSSYERRKREFKDSFMKQDIEWNRTSKDFLKPKPNFSNLKADFALDMYKAAQKDKRKRELKEKYFK